MVDEVFDLSTFKTPSPTSISLQGTPHSIKRAALQYPKSPILWPGWIITTLVWFDPSLNRNLMNIWLNTNLCTLALKLNSQKTNLRVEPIKETIRIRIRINRYHCSCYDSNTPSPSPLRYAISVKVFLVCQLCRAFSNKIGIRSTKAISTFKMKPLLFKLTIDQGTIHGSSLPIVSKIWLYNDRFRKYTRDSLFNSIEEIPRHIQGVWELAMHV